jgi:hypothetical protein
MFPKRLPEFHAVVSALSVQLKAEATILEGQKRAFGPKFRAFAQAQSDSMRDCLLSICDAGQQRSASTQETLSHVTSLPRDLRPVLTHHFEMERSRDVPAKQQDADARLPEQQQLGVQAEVAYRRRFLEALVTPLTAALNVRAQAAKRSLVLASELHKISIELNLMRDQARKFLGVDCAFR